MKLIDYIDKKIKSSDKQRHTLLVGDGGQSKSYQLVHLFQHFVSDEKVVPIYVPLCETKSINSQYSIFNFIYREYINDMHDNSVDYEKKLIYMLKNKSQVKYLLLLDGYNELLDSFTNQSVNETIAYEIKKLCEIDNVYLIVSSRYILTGALFSEFSIANVCDLSVQQIGCFVSNVSTISEQLLELLRSPFYLTKFLEIRNNVINQFLSHSNTNVITAGELLKIYLLNHIPLKFEKDNALDSKSPVLRKLKYCLTELIPEFASYMFFNNTHSISLSAMKDCLKKIQNPISEKWEIIDLVENYIIPINLMYSVSQYENSEYLFVHENYQEFFAALWWTNYAMKKELSQELIEFPLNVQIKKYIGDIFNENLFQSKRDCLSEPSPIERVLIKNRGKFNNSAIQKFNRDCIEIMKSSRNFFITADYSELDLTQCRLNNANCKNSCFCNCLAEKNTFITDKYSDFLVDLDLWGIWTNGNILVRIDRFGSIIATNLIDGSLIYYVDNRSINKNRAIIIRNTYIDDDRIVIDSFYEGIKTYKTSTGELLEIRKTVFLWKDAKGFFKPLFRSVALISTAYKYIYKKGKIYIREESVDFIYGKCIYDKKNNLFCAVNQNNFTFYDFDYNKVGKIVLNSSENYRILNELWNPCQNGWYICEGNNYDEIVFVQIKTEPFRISKKIRLSIDVNNLRLVYVSKNAEKAIALEKNLKVTKIDLNNGNYETVTIPRFISENCCDTSFCIDENFVCFSYYGCDQDEIYIKGICVFDYNNNTYRFKPMERNIYARGVYITSGDFGFVVKCGKTTYLMNSSLIEISSAIPNTGYKLIALENQFYCVSKRNIVGFSCNDLDGKMTVNYNGNVCLSDIEGNNIEIEDSLIHILDGLGMIVFENCRLVHHFATPECDIVESTISDQCAIITYKSDVLQIIAEALVLDKTSLETKRILIKCNKEETPSYIYLFQKNDNTFIQKERKSLLMNSFQFLNGELYCFYDKLYHTSLVKIDLENSFASIIFDLNDRYCDNFISEGFVISAFLESPYVEPYVDSEGYKNITIPSCSDQSVIYIYSLTQRKHYSVDLSELYVNCPENVIIRNISSVAFSNDGNVLAVQERGEVLEDSNSLYFYKFKVDDDQVGFEFLKKIDVIASANYSGCNFSGVNLDAESIQCLLDNGGYIDKAPSD